jgi:hypothetical protein
MQAGWMGLQSVTGLFVNLVEMDERHLKSNTFPLKISISLRRLEDGMSMENKPICI